jgi:hypothetical protein
MCTSGGPAGQLDAIGQKEMPEGDADDVILKLGGHTVSVLPDTGAAAKPRRFGRGSRRQSYISGSPGRILSIVAGKSRTRTPQAS